VADSHPSTAAPSVDLIDDDVIVFPVSFAQRRLWLIDRLDPGNPAYNIPAAVRFQGALDVVMLEHAVNTVVARHESLRTNFLVLDNEPRQAVADARRIHLHRVDLAPTVGDDEVERLITAETLRPFDLAADPLLRVTVYRRSESDHIVQLTIHHIVSDGWSMSVLVKEISEVYAALRLGGEHALPDLPIQYGDYAEWQKDWLTGEVLDRQLAYWRSQLGARSRC